jgi:hypothetical protein
MGCNPERPALLILALAQVGMPFKTMVAECTEMHLRLRLAVTPGLCLIVTSQYSRTTLNQYTVSSYRFSGCFSKAPSDMALGDARLARVRAASHRLLSGAFRGGYAPSAVPIFFIANMFRVSVFYGLGRCLPALSPSLTPWFLVLAGGRLPVHEQCGERDDLQQLAQAARGVQPPAAGAPWWTITANLHAHATHFLYLYAPPCCIFPG